MSSRNIINRDKKRGKRVNKHVETKHNVAAGNNNSRNQQSQETEKFRLLTDIYRDPASGLRAHRQDDDVTLDGSKRKQKGIEVTKERENTEMNALMLLAFHFNIQGNESMMQSSSATRLESGVCSVERISQLTATIMTHAGEAGPSSSQQLSNPSMQTRPKRVIKKPARYTS